MPSIFRSLGFLGLILTLLSACGAPASTTNTAATSLPAATAAPESTVAPTPTAEFVPTPVPSPTTAATTEAAATTQPAGTIVPTAAPTAVFDPTGAGLVVYSGRSKALVEPIIQKFETATGVKVAVRYGDTAALAATILEEGANSPADVFFAQDAGALGAVSKAGVFTTLPTSTLSLVTERFRAPNGEWVGVTGRARVVVYNVDKLKPADLPTTMLDFADPRWKGRLGWAPTNGSFQSFVTAFRKLAGEDAARTWLTAVQANEPKVYQNNTAVVEAVAAGEIEAGFVNHYYALTLIKQKGESYAARNHFVAGGDVGSLVNVAGAGILKTTKNQASAEQFLAYLLSEEAQRYFAEQTFEYPLTSGLSADQRLTPLSDLKTPELDLSNLDDLEGTLDLLRDVGVL